MTDTGTLENPRIPLEEVSCRARLDAVANRARQSVGHTERLSKYLAMAGEFFAVVIEGMQFQRDIVTQVSLYHLELCTRCFASGCLFSQGKKYWSCLQARKHTHC